MSRLYCVLGGALPWRVALLAAIAASCTVNERGRSRIECRAGEPCGDAAADTQSEVRVGPSDAHVEMPPPPAEAGASLACPVGCNPEDVLACAAAPVQALRAADGEQEEGAVQSQVAVSLTVIEAQLGAQDASAGERGADAGAPMVQSGEAGAGSESSAFTDGQMSMSMPLDAALDGGAIEAGGGQLGVLDAAAIGGSGGPPTGQACQLVSRSGNIEAECAQSGLGSEGVACASSRDCAPGLGCVGSAGAGQCLPYCCGGNDACGAGRYCTERPLRAPDIADGQGAPLIPVCAVADNCSLTLGSCTERGACSCPEGLACTIVRADTTTCVVPGSGREGNSCPCASGYFCSQGTNTCLQFCNTKDAVSSCGERECQPGPRGFPMGWGLCVGD